MKVKDIVIEKMDTNVPKKGWYVELNWYFSSEENEMVVKEGPIPEERKDLVIELAEVLENMVEKFTYTSMEDDDNYDDVPGVNKFFNCRCEGLDKDSEDYKIIQNLGLSIEYSSNEWGGCGELQSYSIIWHDGVMLNQYSTKIDIDYGEG